MRITMLTTALASVGVLAGCASAPREPRPDESTRRAVNDSQVIEMIRAKQAMQDAQRELELTRRRIQAERMMDEAQALRMQPTSLRDATDPRRLTAVASGANIIYTARFATGSTSLALPPVARARIIETARNAPLVVLRGRTDALQDTAADGRIARQRAMAAYSMLLNAGIKPERIRTTWQASGDPAAPLTTAEGRAASRRVEIEVYEAAPKFAPLVPDDATVASK
jgi:outer membrane protein OmpA-like peptidoglycan-associated protein